MEYKKKEKQSLFQTEINNKSSHLSWEKNDSKKHSLLISNPTTKSSNLPWIEKYRPRILNDIIYQTDVINMLKTVVTTKDLPHLLLYGPPGTGKTSTILALARELFGPKIMYERIIELNASDDRGIGAVRNKIKVFAKTAVGCSDSNYPCPSYKIIILDEADAMTFEAQSALRKTMETYSHVTRFCFICNYVTEIISPIVSRCSKLYFKPLDQQYMIDQLTKIAQKEKLKPSPRIIQKIAQLSYGDMRKAIMTLQSSYYTLKYKKKITLYDIYWNAGVTPKKIIDQIIFYSSRKIKDAVQCAEWIYRNGFSIYNVIVQISLQLSENETINDVAKSRIILHISEVERRINEGANEYLQLLNVLTCIYQNITLENN